MKIQIKALQSTSKQEGEWSRDIAWDSEHNLLGLDSSVHTNDGYKLVMVPKRITGAFRITLNIKRIERAMLYPDGMWSIILDGKNFSIRDRDFTEWQERGFYGFSIDGTKLVTWFKDK